MVIIIFVLFLRTPLWCMVALERYSISTDGSINLEPTGGYSEPIFDHFHASPITYAATRNDHDIKFDNIVENTVNNNFHIYLGGVGRIARVVLIAQLKSFNFDDHRSSKLDHG